MHPVDGFLSVGVGKSANAKYICVRVSVRKIRARGEHGRQIKQVLVLVNKEGLLINQKKSRHDVITVETHIQRRHRHILCFRFGFDFCVGLTQVFHG